MPTRFYRIVDTAELREFLTSNTIRKSKTAWPPYRANEVAFVLSDQTTLNELRSFVERLRDDGKTGHLLEIEILGQLPWQIESDASFDGYTKAIAVRSDIVQTDTVKIRHVAAFQDT